MEGKQDQTVEEQSPVAEEGAGDRSASPAEQEPPVRGAEEEVAPVANAEEPEAGGELGSEPEAAGEPEPEAETPPEAEPEDELAVALRERGEYLALAQRTQADFENYRKRAAKEAAAAGHRAKSGLVGELLPVVDNLERALASAGDGEEHLADGLRLVHSELIAVLGRHGVEQFDPAGERFDPAFHEALSTREADGADAGVILDVIEKGYNLNGAVLRPARVVVSG